jgi:CRISPR-associated protein Csd1
LGRIGCAPISKETARHVEIALTRLLDPTYPGPDGSPLPSRSFLLKNDTVLVYWSPDGGSVDFLSGLDSGDPEKVRELLRAPVTGRRSALDDPSRFFALILTGMTGRAIVRSLVESTVGAVASNVDRYFHEAEIVRPWGQSPGTYPLSRLRRALAAFEDLDRLPPQQAADIYLAILLGRPFPRSVLEGAARRNRVDLIPEGDRGGKKEDVLAARCSLIKAYLRRNIKEEITVALDAQRRDPPYLLGRLLATLDKVQGEALGDVNATIVDRYYGSASTTPAAVFPMLVRRAQHHFGKLRRENTGLGIVRERLVQEISAELSKFPKILNLESQGLFALGFYHQRQSFFTKPGDRQ